jgi:hypothetical protein
MEAKNPMASQKREQIMTSFVFLSVERVLLRKTCNPSFLGGWDQEDCGSRQAWAKKQGRYHLNRQIKKKKTGCMPIIPVIVKQEDHGPG